MSRDEKSAPQQATTPEGPYDPSNPEHVAARQKTAKKREDARREGLREVVSTPKGRAWMRHLLVEKLMTRVGHTLPSRLFTGNSSTFYNAALRECGDLIATELMTFAPKEFRLMEDEGETTNG